MASTVDSNTFTSEVPGSITTQSVEDQTDDSLRLAVWSTSDKARNIMIGSVLLLINSLTLVSLIRTRSFRPHTKVLVGSLTCTDMLMGVITIVPRILPWQTLSHEPMCVVRFTGVMLSVYGTCLSITSVTLDRLLALTFPIVYRTGVSVGKSVLVVVSVWALSALLTAASIVGGFEVGTSCDMLLVVPTRGLIIQATVEILSAFAVTTLYIYIGMKLRRRRRRIRTELSSRLRAPITAPGAGDIVSTSKSEKRTTVTAMVLAVCFLFGYIPVAGYLIWVVASGVDRLEETQTQRLLILIACPLGNSILDPLVYFWRLVDWRALLMGKCRKVQVHPSSDNPSNSTRSTRRSGAGASTTSAHTNHLQA